MSDSAIKTNHPTRRAILGIIAVILIVIFSNWLVRSTSLGNRSLDLTENKRHTLTEGTKSILGELRDPVIIRYYATRKSEAMPRHVKNYMRKVDDLLNRYRELAKGRIRIEHLDPQPDTDAEDSANLDGISGQRVNEENLYFGLSLSCLDQQTALPFLDPDDETMLEYHLSSAIANVTTFEKKSIGLMTTLLMAGKPASKPNQKAQAPWIVYQQLQQRYQLKNLGMNPESLNPENTPVLLLVHPANISAHTEYLIDQYLLKGGIIIACLDSYAMTAQTDPTTGMVVKASHLPKLLPRWGIGMDSTSVIADGKFPSDFGENRRLYAHLALTKDAISSEDEIITRGFESLYLPLAAGFTINQRSDLKIDKLIESSTESLLIPANNSSKPDPGLFTRQRPSGKKFIIAMRLQGLFPSAFPEGDPATQNPEGAAKAHDQDEPPPLGMVTPASLQKSTSPGTVYLLSDADFLYDIAGFDTAKNEPFAINNNAALLFNILDQSTGSKHLIGSRSRAATTRPFTIIKEMETEFAQELQEDVAKARSAMTEIVTQLQLIQQQRAANKTVIPSREEQESYNQLIAKQIQLRSELREKEKNLRRKKDQLYNKITWLTVASTPLFVAITGLCVWAYRRRSTRAR